MTIHTSTHTSTQSSTQSLTQRPHTTAEAPALPAGAARRGGAHRAGSSTRRVVASVAATLAAVAVVLGVALGAGVSTAGPAEAAARGTNAVVTGRVCGPGQPAGWITYRASNGDHGTVRTGRGWYALTLHRVPRSGEWISGTAYCPAPRPMHHVRAVRFGFFVPAGPVVHRNIR